MHCQSVRHGGKLVLWQSVALRYRVLPFTWSEDIRTALLCYSLLKVHDQAMLTRDGESLVLFSSLQLWDGLWGRNGFCMDLGNGQCWISVNLCQFSPLFKGLFVAYFQHVQ